MPTTQLSQKNRIDQTVAAIREVTDKAAQSQATARKFLADIGVKLNEEKKKESSVKKK